MTITQALNWGKNYLQKHTIVDTESSARFLLAFVLKVEPSQLLLQSDREVSNKEQQEFQKLLDRRAHHEPIAYILGYHEFCGLRLTVTPAVLIPRPETEQLIILVLDYINSKYQIRNSKQIKKSNDKNSKKLSDFGFRASDLTIIDIGTGSGAIAFALASQLKDKANITATDISTEALKIAESNAKQLGLDRYIDFVQADLLHSPDSQFLIPDSPIIVANLPYVPHQRMAQLQPDVRNFEPGLALDGGSDGLDCYRQLFEQIKVLQTTPRAIFCEIDETQGRAMRELVHSSWPSAKVNITKDVAGLDRFAKIII